MSLPNPNTTAVITTTTMTVTAKFTTALIVAFGIAFFMVASAPGPSMSDPVGLVRIATMVIMWLGAVVHMMAVVYKRVIEVIAYSFALLFLSSLDTGGMDVCEIICLWFFLGGIVIPAPFIWLSSMGTMSWMEVLKTTTLTAVFIQSITTLSQDAHKDSSNYYINLSDLQDPDGDLLRSW